MRPLKLPIYIGLKTRLVLSIGGLVVAVVVVMSITATLREEKTLEKELRNRGIAMAGDLAKFVVRPMISQDLPALRRFVLDVTEQDYVRYAIVLDAHGKVLMHSNMSEIGKVYKDRLFSDSSDATEKGYTHPHLSEEGELHCDIFMPIQVSGFTLGTVALGYSHEAVENEIAAAFQQMFLIGLSITIIGGIAAYLLAAFLSGPITQITTAVGKVAAGDPYRPLKIQRRDEIGVLAASVNKMARDLEKHRDHLERLVQERTDELTRANERLTEEVKEREVTEKKLVAVKNSLQHLLESSPVVVYSSNPQGSYLTTFVSQNVTTQLGYEVMEFQRDPKFWENHVHSRDAETILSDFKKGCRRFEYRFRQKDGTFRWLRDEIRVMHDEQGKPMEIVGCLGDITEHKEIENSLRESERKFRSLFEESRDGIYIVSEEGLFVDINQSAVDLFGYTREEMIGLDVRNLYVNRRDWDRFHRDIEREGSVTDYEVKSRRKDGKQIDCLLTATVRRDREGTRFGHQGIIRDISRQKQMEIQLQQAQKMEAVGTLAGGIAHDFNNILQGILGYTELLLVNKEATGMEFDYLKQIDKSAEKGAQLVRQLMIFSRKVASELRPLNLNREIIQADGFIRRTIPRMIAIELSLADDLKLINADAIQLEQIIMNLIVNANDAMSDGGKITLKTSNIIVDGDLQTHADVSAGEYVLLSISDNGHGMDRDVVEHIFEPFYTTKEVGKGTGLGLAMVYGIVKNHGGYITCDSAPGEGTVFNIYFPALITGVLEEETEEKKQSSMKRGHETILFIDDEASLREQGREMLSAYGYSTILAETGEMALEIYRGQKNSIDLVVLDLGMPGMGGHKCMRELVKINPEIKILISSGYGNSEEMREALNSGGRAFLSKPFRLEALLNKVRAVLDLK